MTWTPDDAEIRRNALALYKAWRAADEAYQDAGSADDMAPEASAELREADRVYGEKAKAARDEYEAKVEEIETKYRRPTPLLTAAQAAKAAYDAAPGPGLLTSAYDDEAVICAKTGLPIWEEEETVRDDDTDEIFIRAACDLPPRPAIEEDE